MLRGAREDGDGGTAHRHKRLMVWHYVALQGCGGVKFTGKTLRNTLMVPHLRRTWNRR